MRDQMDFKKIFLCSCCASYGPRELPQAYFVLWTNFSLQ